MESASTNYGIMAFRIVKAACVFLMLLGAIRCSEETCSLPQDDTKAENFQRLITEALDAAKLLHEDASRFCPALEQLNDGIKKDLEDTKEQLARRTDAFMHCKQIQKFL